MVTQYINNWLSNMVKLETPIIIDGINYCSVENAYQAAKTLNLEKRAHMAVLEPGYSKKVGRKLKLRDDWESIKLTVMYIALTQKFNQPQWKAELEETGAEYLVEWNNWKDNIWGVPCKISPKWFAIPNAQNGDNYLGRLLMLIRNNEPINTNSCSFDDSDKLRTLNNILLDKLAPTSSHEKLINSTTHYETSLLPSQRVSVTVYGSSIGTMTPEIATRLDNLIDLGAQIHLCDNPPLSNIVKDYLDSKCYTRVTWSSSQNLSNTQYGLLIKHDSDDSNYNYHAANKTRIVSVSENKKDVELAA